MSDDDDEVWAHTQLQLSTTSLSYNSDQQEDNPETQRLLVEGNNDGNGMPPVGQEGGRLPAARAFLIRALALLCACSLSVGSH